MKDARYIRIRTAIERLSADQIKRILEYPEEMVYDGYNFDPYTKRY